MEKTSLFLRNNYHKTCQYTAPVSLNDTAEDTALSSSYLLVRAKSNGKNVLFVLLSVSKYQDSHIFYKPKGSESPSVLHSCSLCYRNF